MSAEASVLFDAPGPKARVRYRIIAIIGSLFGALYPAWRAAGIDPVEVMVNE